MQELVYAETTATQRKKVELARTALFPWVSDWERNKIVPGHKVGMHVEKSKLDAIICIYDVLGVSLSVAVARVGVRANAESCSSNSGLLHKGTVSARVDV